MCNHGFAALGAGGVRAARCLRPALTVRHKKRVWISGGRYLEVEVVRVDVVDPDLRRRSPAVRGLRPFDGMGRRARKGEIMNAIRLLVAVLAIAGASMVAARADQEAGRSGAGAKSVAGATRGGSVKSATDKASAGNATAGDTKARKSTAKKSDSDGKKRGTAAAKRAEPKKPKAAAAVKRPGSSAATKGAADGAGRSGATRADASRRTPTAMASSGKAS